MKTESWITFIHFNTSRRKSTLYDRFLALPLQTHLSCSIQSSQVVCKVTTIALPTNSPSQIPTWRKKEQMKMESIYHTKTHNTTLSVVCVNYTCFIDNDPRMLGINRRDGTRCFVGIIDVHIDFKKWH